MQSECVVPVASPQEHDTIVVTADEAAGPGLQYSRLPAPRDPLLADPAARRAGEGGKGEGEVVVISFSHFLPRQELCPEKRFLIEPNLPKVGMCVFF